MRINSEDSSILLLSLRSSEPTSWTTFQHSSPTAAH